MYFLSQNGSLYFQGVTKHIFIIFIKFKNEKKNKVDSFE